MVKQLSNYYDVCDKCLNNNILIIIIQYRLDVLKDRFDDIEEEIYKK